MPHPIVVDVALHPDEFLDPATVRARACARARIPIADILAHEVTRKSIDARKGRVRINARIELRTAPIEPAAKPEPPSLRVSGEPRVIVVGAGPAGLFCARELALHGVPCVVVERGQAVRQRRRDVADLSARGQLHPESNYCFGEGGAGTFSDGKLYTRSDKRGDVRAILRALVEYGAPPQILVNARPHIGTNRLPGVITALREHLASAGVQIRFGSRVTELVVQNGEVAGVQLAGGETIPASAVVLATGHSAPDVLQFCEVAGVALSRKPFALGVRIEHAQSLIDQIQFGDLAGHPALGPAAYRLVERQGDQSVFSFCMCPGGHIVPAATEPGHQVVNGWSPSRHQGAFANSGFVVEVDDAMLAAAGFDPADHFAGLSFRAHFERLAYDAGGGAFVGPAQRLVDFVRGTPSGALPRSSYPRGVVPAPLHEMLGPLTTPLRAALNRLGHKMPGFLDEDAIAVGVESRTSSPVRIDRDRDSLASPGLPGLYPCAEGAGYAGGIMSAAIDGVRVAEAIARTL